MVIERSTLDDHVMLVWTRLMQVQEFLREIYISCKWHKVLPLHTIRMNLRYLGKTAHC